MSDTQGFLFWDFFLLTVWVLMNFAIGEVIFRAYFGVLLKVIGFLDSVYRIGACLKIDLEDKDLLFAFKCIYWGLFWFLVCSCKSGMLGLT